MATRFFFRDTTNLHTYSLPNSENSTALTTTTGANAPVPPNSTYNLSIVNSATSSGITSTSGAFSTAQQHPIGIFYGPPLRAQTVNANTWTIAFTANESNAAANAFLAVSVYIWRPSTSSVVGFIRDSATTLGVEFANTLQTVTFSGSSVSGVQAGDILVSEMWNVATQSMTTTYTITFNTSNTTTPRYIETPQDLAFLSNEQAFIID